MSYANDMTTTVDPQLASQLRIAVMRLSRRLRRERADDSLTASQVSALATIDRYGPVSLGELASLEYVQPPSMTRIVTSLEQMLLVRRAPHVSDGRQVILETTAPGQRLLASDRERRDAWLCHRIRDLSAEERQTLHKASGIIERLAQS